MLRGWRNWQTHYLEVVAPVRAWRFKSSPAHSMLDLRLGIVIVLVSAFGYVSNFLNGRYLNYGPVRWLYYVGALVHESSHAVLCLFTGAKIREFTVLSDQPRVVHQRSKIPLVGELFISVAPIAGGLLFLFLVNRYLLGNFFILPQLAPNAGWSALFTEPIRLLAEVRLFAWQSWVMIFLSLNAGAMLGPSFQDLKNSWLALIILFFVSAPALVNIGLAALGLIFTNIAIQIVAILVLGTISLVRHS